MKLPARIRPFARHDLTYRQARTLHNAWQLLVDRLRTTTSLEARRIYATNCREFIAEWAQPVVLTAEQKDALAREWGDG